jgi:predicted dehydrogenase
MPSNTSKTTFSSALHYDRRQWLKAVGTSAVAAATPSIVPASVFGSNAPSNRVNLGLIGCGHQSQRLIPSFLAHEDARIVAVCDVNRSGTGYYYPDQVLGRETGKRWVEEHYAKTTRSGQYKGCDAYSDFREVLARKDIDAVIIVVPDHWHAVIAIAAMRAGKDVYCEKPLALTIPQGRAMVKAVRKYQRIFQTGAQFRSSPAIRKACELVRNGRLGQIKLVRTWVDGNSFPSPGPGWQPQPIHKGFDYKFWLGPAPPAPFHMERCFHRWRYIRDYSNGQTVNFGAHTNDIAQWGLGMDGTTPVEFEDMGAEFPPAGSLFDTAVKTAFLARYANGVELICETRKSSATKFEGTEGRLEITLGGKLVTYPEHLQDTVIGPNEIHLPVSNPAHTVHVRDDVDADHAGNFVKAVKARKDPLEPVEVGHSSASLCILGSIAQLVKRRFTWNPETELSGDVEVNAMLDRDLRAPWTL